MLRPHKKKAWNGRSFGGWKKADKASLEIIRSGVVTHATMRWCPAQSQAWPSFLSTTGARRAPRAGRGRPWRRRSRAKKFIQHFAWRRKPGPRFRPTVPASAVHKRRQFPRGARPGDRWCPLNRDRHGRRRFPSFSTHKPTKSPPPKAKQSGRSRRCQGTSAYLGGLGGIRSRRRRRGRRRGRRGRGRYRSRG